MNKLSTQLGILGIIIAGLFGLTIPESDEAVEDGVVVSNANRRGRMQYAADRTYKLFEFAPADGAGMTDVCPTPNWVVQSENITVTPWFTSTGAGIPTFTADYDGVADRMQYAACPTPGLYSANVQTIAGGSSGGTFTIEVKGTSGAGYIGMIIGSASTYTGYSCAYNSSTYTKCSVSTNVAVYDVWFGCINTVLATPNPGNTGAGDVLIKNAQFNVGSTVAPYFKTTTVAANSQPTTAKGQVLTASRASVAYCNANTDATSNTGIVDGSLVMLPANMIRVERKPNGRLSIRPEETKTNYIIQSQALDVAPWASFGTVTSVTANYATAPDGTKTAERLVIPACPVSSNAVYQVGIATTTGLASFYVKGNGTSGNIGAAWGTTSYIGLTCAYNSTTWTKCITPTFTSGVELYIGCINSASVTNNPGNTGALDVLVWGVQVEAGSLATSYYPTTTAAATRAVDNISGTGLSIASNQPLSWSTALQIPYVLAGGVWGTATGAVQDVSNRTQLYRQNSNVFTCDVLTPTGTRSSSYVQAMTANEDYRQACSFSGSGASSTLTPYLNGIAGTPSAAGVTGTFTINTILPCALGPFGYNAPSNGLCSDVCLDNSLDGCTQ